MIDTWTKRNKFVYQTLDYMRQHNDFPYWNAEEAITEALMLLCNDIGAAQAYLDVIGVDVDLYSR